MAKRASLLKQNERVGHFKRINYFSLIMGYSRSLQRRTMAFISRPFSVRPQEAEWTGKNWTGDEWEGRRTGVQRASQGGTFGSCPRCQASFSSCTFAFHILPDRQLHQTPGDCLFRGSSFRGCPQRPLANTLLLIHLHPPAPHWGILGSYSAG